MGRRKSPLPFGVLSPGHEKGKWNCSKATGLVTIAFRRSVPRPPHAEERQSCGVFDVTIAFRRSVPRPPFEANAASIGSTRVTIAFRRSVPRPRDDATKASILADLSHHCLSAFCPPATHAGNRTPPEGGRSHHCLSAFCPPATPEVAVRQAAISRPVTIAFRRSVPRPQVCCKVNYSDDFNVTIAFRRSVPRPQNSSCTTYAIRCPVTIAFRRSVPRPLNGLQQEGNRGGAGHHCLSAFCPPATSYPLAGGVLAAAGHHCLSAFCPPATTRKMRCPALPTYVTIAFRRSVPRPPRR